MSASPKSSSSNSDGNEPAKSGGIAGKLVKVVLLLAIVGGGASMYMHGTHVGQDRAVSANPTQMQAVSRQNATWVGPWEWTSEEWSGLKGTVVTASKDMKSTVSEKSKELASRVQDWRRKSSSAAGGAAASTTPVAGGETGAAASAGTAAAPVPPPAGTLSPDAQRAHRLVQEGSDLWEKHDLAASKAKLDEAMVILKQLQAQTPVQASVADDVKLASDLLEDINSR